MDQRQHEPKCVIISAGSFPDVEIELDEGDFCIACDAGFKYAQQLGILPDLIVGDFDSASEAGPDVMRGISEIASLSPERILKLDVKKDDTDTLRAVRIGLSRGYKKFIFYGALGGKRFDHTLANIQTLLFVKHSGARGYIMESDKMILIAENETIRFNRGNTGILSVFSLAPVSRGVSLYGLMYNMERGTLTSDFPLGVSNEFIIDEEAVVTVEDGTLLITVSWAQ
ncbi:MAG: thiamine diphosphokinase [Butyrivibrio sp.]|nr:thiamine diphosphokinase [Butyrivibrio sp.]